MTDYTIGVDIHPAWQGVRTPDGIYEGWPEPVFVIQKGADGHYPFLGRDSFKRQQASIADIPRRGLYAYWRTTQSARAQGDMLIDLIDTGADIIASDFEGYGNMINAATISTWAAQIERVERERPAAELWLYTNWSILEQVQHVKSAAWVKQRRWWIAGGPFYNRALHGLDDEIVYASGFADSPRRWAARMFAQYPHIVALQFSADGNHAADEFDFEANGEQASIDINICRYTTADWGITEATEMPETDGNLEQMLQAVYARINGLEARLVALESREQSFYNGDEAPDTPQPVAVIAVKSKDRRQVPLFRLVGDRLQLTGDRLGGNEKVNVYAVPERYLASNKNKHAEYYEIANGKYATRWVEASAMQKG